jgi:two-component system, OmpR family, response regulator
MSRDHLILIVDDDPHIRRIVRFALETAGFRTEEATDGTEALRLFRHAGPDLVVLDVLMPGMDGTEVCAAIRRESAVPIIFLSSRDEEVDRVLGLELGGDDYVTKPFSPRELVARVKAILRRGREAVSRIETTPPVQSEKMVRHGLLRLDADRFLSYWGETEVSLTVTEFNILKTMLRFPGKVFTRDELMSRAYPIETIVSDRTIDSHIRGIRQKFLQAAAGDPIETVHGLGYRLAPCL